MDPVNIDKMLYGTEEEATAEFEKLQEHLEGS